MLMDSAHIQGEGGRGGCATRARARWHAGGGGPLYTVGAGAYQLDRFVPTDYDDWIEPGPGVRCRFRDAGHILGSAILEIDVGERGHTCRLVARATLASRCRPVLGPGADRPADYQCVESTLRQPRPPLLRRHLRRARARLAAHARGRWRQRDHPGVRGRRTQEVLFCARRPGARRTHRPARRRGRLPMASAVTALTVRHAALWDDETRALRLGRGQLGTLPCAVVQDVERNRRRSMRCWRLVVIFGKRYAMPVGSAPPAPQFGRRECAVVIAGFQAAGTLGRRLVDGAHQGHPVRRTYPGTCAHPYHRRALRPRRSARTPDWLRGLARRRGAPSWRTASRLPPPPSSRRSSANWAGAGSRRRGPACRSCSSERPRASGPERAARAAQAL